MKRLVNIIGSVLVAGGLALLLYVGVAYMQMRRTASTSTPMHHWTLSEQQRGERLAQELARNQEIVVPKQVAAVVPAGSEPATRLVIPKLQLDTRVVETPATDGIWPVADWAVGHLTTSPNPGAPGNMALDGHDDIKGEIFKRINELGPGDQMQIYTRHAVYTYVVTSERVVDINDTSVLTPTALPTVTLVTCTPYWVDTQRLVVQGVLKSRAAV